MRGFLGRLGLRGLGRGRLVVSGGGWGSGSGSRLGLAGRGGRRLVLLGASGITSSNFVDGGYPLLTFVIRVGSEDTVLFLLVTRQFDEKLLLLVTVFSDLNSCKRNDLRFAIFLLGVVEFLLGDLEREVTFNNLLAEETLTVLLG